MPLTEEVLNKYLEYFAGNYSLERAKYTVNQYIRPFIMWLGLSEVTGQLLMSWRQSLIKAKTKIGGPGRPAITRSPASRNRHLGAVKAFLNWARKSGYVRIEKDTIYDTLESFPVGRPAPKPLSESQILDLLEACIKREDMPRMQGITRFVVLALLTGARPGELRELRWKNVDWEHRLITVEETKNNRQRVIPFDSPLMEKFLRTWHLQDAGEPEARIAGWPGKVTNPERWKPVFKMAGLSEYTLKSLRTTAVAFYASARSGLDNEYMIESRFGHSSEISKHYYRQPLWGVRGRGPSVENYYGPLVERQLRDILERENRKALQ